MTIRHGLTDGQINHRLRDDLSFRGSIWADELPLPHQAPSGCCWVVNYTPSPNATPPEFAADPQFPVSGSHWVYIRAAGPNHTAEYSDSFGARPDDIHQTLHVPSPGWHKWLTANARQHGHEKSKYNAVDWQCEIRSEACGYFAVYTVLHGMPTEDNGEIRGPWKELYAVIRSCAQIDNMLAKLVKINL
jgi:hypothetical protein